MRKPARAELGWKNSVCRSRKMGAGWGISGQEEGGGRGGRDEGGQGQVTRASMVLGGNWTLFCWDGKLAEDLGRNDMI